MLQNNSSFQINVNSNDRKNLKIEEQEDQDEELMERNPNVEEEETNNSNKIKNNESFIQVKNNVERRDQGFSRSQGQNRQNIGDNNQNNMESTSSEKSPKLNSVISNSMLAKREIPKQNESTNTINPGFINQNALQNNESENNTITGMGISQNNLDFLNTQTPQPQHNYYQNLSFFGNSQLTPLYPAPGMQSHLNHVQHQHNINHPSLMNQHEATSPMFVLGNGMTSPAPRSALPLFKPPMSGLGNTTPSAITPLLNNSYFVYPQSLNMLTPQPFPNYNTIMNPYYMQSKGFPSITKIGGGTLNDIDKTSFDNSENNSILNSFNQQNNNNFNNFDNSGLQSLPNFNFAPPTPGMIPTSIIGQNNHQNKNTLGSNHNQNQQQNPNDINNHQNQENINNKNGGVQIQKQEKIEELSGDKFSKILKEFSSLDPESQKKFQMLIGQNYLPQEYKIENNNKVEPKLSKEES